MDKKKITSRGVSFASLALVSGMVSYLGFTNKDSITALNKTNQSQTVNQTQPAQDQNGNSNDSFGSSSDENRTSSNFNNQSTNDNGSSFNSGNDQSTEDNSQAGFSGNENNQFAGGGVGHHRGMDTTTGGT
jgi:hypothetical protein